MYVLHKLSFERSGVDDDGGDDDGGGKGGVGSAKFESGWEQFLMERLGVNY